MNQKAFLHLANAARLLLRLHELIKMRKTWAGQGCRQRPQPNLLLPLPILEQVADLGVHLPVPLPALLAAVDLGVAARAPVARDHHQVTGVTDPALAHPLDQLLLHVE